MQEKRAKIDLPFNIQPEIVARYGLGGLLTGGALASALNLVHMLRELSRQRAEKVPTETDESTLVLTLPPGRKAAAAKPAPYAPAKGKYITDGNVGDYDAHEPPPSTGPVNPELGIVNKKSLPITVKRRAVLTNKTMKGKRRQGPRESGQFGVKTANWPTLTAALLAMGAGGGLGYSLIDKLYEIRRLKAGEKELDTARQEYLDLLAKDKEAGFNELFTIPQEKLALFGDKKRTFGMIDLPLGLAALAFILGTGGSAYLTKRILDQLGAKKPPKGVQPAVKRIVFRSTPGEEGTNLSEEIGPEEEPKVAESIEELEKAQEADEVFDAALGTYLDIMSGAPAVTGTDAVKAKLAEIGETPASLIKTAATDFDSLIATLQANPKLRQLMQGAMMESHPIIKHFKWATKLPVLQQIADAMMYKKINQIFKPATPAAPKTAEELGFQQLCKQAGILAPRLADIAASFYGSTLASQVGDEDESKTVPEVSPEERARELLGRLRLAAEDKPAAEFVMRNKAAIIKILKRLAAEGKI